MGQKQSDIDRIKELEDQLKVLETIHIANDKFMHLCNVVLLNIRQYDSVSVNELLSRMKQITTLLERPIE